MKPFVIFTAADFDRLRSTLRAHLGEVLLERDHRTLIMNLVDDIKKVASDEGNRILNSKGKRARGKPVTGEWWTKGEVPSDTHEALIFGEREIKK